MRKTRRVFVMESLRKEFAMVVVMPDINAGYASHRSKSIPASDMCNSATDIRRKSDTHLMWSKLSSGNRSGNPTCWLELFYSKWNGDRPTSWTIDGPRASLILIKRSLLPEVGKLAQFRVFPIPTARRETFRIRRRRAFAKSNGTIRSTIVRISRLKSWLSLPSLQKFPISPRSSCYSM